MGVPLDPLAPMWLYESPSEDEPIENKNPANPSLQEQSDDDDNLGMPLKIPGHDVIVHDFRGVDCTAKEVAIPRRSSKQQK